MAVTLQTVTQKYAQAKQEFRSKEDALKFDVAILTNPKDAKLAYMGFFFAKQAFDKALVDNKSLEKVKHLNSTYNVLKTMSEIVAKLFPSITLPDFRTLEGLKDLQGQLDGTVKYREFLDQHWEYYQTLKTAKGTAKKEFSAFVKQQKTSGTFNEAHVAQCTTDKRIIKLAKKIKAE